MEIPAACPLFAGIDPANIPGLLSCLGAREINCGRGETILQEGEAAQEVGLLLSGRAEVVSTEYDGSRSILISVAEGQLFAESFACAQVEKLPVSVVAALDCRALLLDCRRLLTTCSRACAFHRQIVFNLLHIVAQKNLAMHRRALITSGRTTRDKLLSCLHMAARESGSRSVTLPFDRQGLADYLGVDRSGLSAELGKLRREGVLEFHKNSFRLLRLPEE